MARLMTSDYRIIGSEESPYSVKVRAYFRYKGLPHTWQTRAEARELFQEHAKLPLIPLVITPDGQGLQDSTPILAQLEAQYPEPTIVPGDPVAGFMSTLLEEFADEWGNKWMFHYRWAREADQQACSRRLAEMMQPQAQGAALDAAARDIRERMIDRVWFVGSSPQTAKQIEASFKDTLALLEPHFARRPYLFGARPALADFGLWGQLYNAHRDPTPRGIMEIHAPNTIEWIARMQDPAAEGEFESWDSLAGTLGPLISDQVAGLFLPWSAANASAIATGAETFSVHLRGETWEQKPQKYHARSLAALIDGYRSAADNDALNAALEHTGCRIWLAT